MNPVASQSEENTLVQGEQQETKVEEPVAEQTDVPVAEQTDAPAAEQTDAPAEEVERKVYQTKKEVLERAKEIAHAEGLPQKDEVEYLKTTFYKLHIAEREAQQKAYLVAGGDPATYQVVPDAEEEAFKAEMAVIKERRQQQFREQEAEKEENLQKKLDIIEKLKAMVT